MPSERAQKLSYRLIQEGYPDEVILRRAHIDITDLIVLRAILAAAPAPQGVRPFQSIH